MEMLPYGDGFNLDVGTFGECLDGEGGAGRVGLGEEFSVCLVDLGEVVDVIEEHRYLYYVL